MCRPVQLPASLLGREGITPLAAKANGSISGLPALSFYATRFHEFASHSIGQSEWAKAYYQHLRDDEKRSHQAAIRAAGPQMDSHHLSMLEGRQTL